MNDDVKDTRFQITSILFHGSYRRNRMWAVNWTQGLKRRQNQQAPGVRHPQLVLKKRSKSPGGMPHPVFGSYQSHGSSIRSSVGLLSFPLHHAQTTAIVVYSQCVYLILFCIFHCHIFVVRCCVNTNIILLKDSLTRIKQQSNRRM